MAGRISMGARREVVSVVMDKLTVADQPGLAVAIR
jgi:hypothetical protein